MRVFFTDRSDIGESEIFLSGDNHHHIKNVLRLPAGEEITVKTGGSISYVCEIKSYEDDRVVCTVKESIQTDTELPVYIDVFQGIPKGDKLELIIQKCTELGAAGIIPVMTSRSIVKLDEKKKKAKHERWEKIALNASEQSRRGRVCHVGEPVTFAEAMDMAAGYDRFIIPYECAEGFSYTREVFDSIKSGERLALFIGPEGGFSDEEISLAKAAGADVITLGKRILRTETAAMYVLSVMGYLFEEDD